MGQHAAGPPLGLSGFPAAEKGVGGLGGDRPESSGQAATSTRPVGGLSVCLVKVMVYLHPRKWCGWNDAPGSHPLGAGGRVLST